jgi:hypothetical protein
MVDAVTPNKSIDLPTTGEYVNAWGPVVNGNFSVIDEALGGLTTISLTGVTAGNYPLTLSQYQPLNIEFNGLLNADVGYSIPAGVGGIWSLWNNTTIGAGDFLVFEITAGNGVILPAGRSLVVSDGANVYLAQTLTFSRLTDMIANSQVPVGAVTQWQASLALTGAQIVTGTVPNAALPNPGVGPGVTIAADPGTTPTGPAGSIWYYY